MTGPGEICEALCARGFRAYSVSCSARTGEVERVDIEGEKPDSTRVADALKVAREIAATIRPRPSLLDAVVLRLSGRSLGAELAADVQGVLERAADEAIRRLDVPPEGLADAVAAVGAPVS